MHGVAEAGSVRAFQSLGREHAAYMATPLLALDAWLKAISKDIFLASFLPIWQVLGNLDLPNSKKLAKVSFGYFRSASLASFWKVRFAISFAILANNASARLSKPDHPTTPDARLALTSLVAGGT